MILYGISLEKFILFRRGFGQDMALGAFTESGGEFVRGGIQALCQFLDADLCFTFAADKHRHLTGLRLGQFGYIDHQHIHADASDLGHTLTVQDDLSAPAQRE